MSSIAVPAESALVAARTASPARRSTGRKHATNPFPVDTGAALTALMRRYHELGKPIPVSFRELVSWVKVGERATHYLHPYPAKLLPHIAHFFLASKTLVAADDTVLDPFGGTGTVALETALSGRDALYADANPLARLIAATKVQPVEDDAIRAVARAVVERFPGCRARKRPDVVNLERWYTPETIDKLVRLRSVLRSLPSSTTSGLTEVTFSAVARKVSLADPRFSVPVRRRPGEPTAQDDVLEVFLAQLETNRIRMAELRQCAGLGQANCVGDDARRLLSADGSAPLADGSVGMIVTSPPYAGAQKYVRAVSLNLGWLGLARSDELRELESGTIGREHFSKAALATSPATGLPDADHLLGRIALRNPLRAHIAGTYLAEMRAALAESARVLRSGGHMVLVIGDNTVCGERFPSSEFLPSMLHDMGMHTVLSLVDTIRSRGLLTSRASTAGVILTESVIVLQKS